MGILGSEWVGLKYLIDFVTAYNFKQLLTNTLMLSIYGFAVGFPIAIIFALMLHYSVSDKLKRVVQTISFAPHFISTVVMVGILQVFLADQSGLVNVILKELGLKPIRFWECSSFQTCVCMVGCLAAYWMECYYLFGGTY